MSGADQLSIETRRGLTCLAVRVQPRAARDRVIGVHDGALKVALTAPPVDDRANRSLVVFLARISGVSRSRIRVVSGLRNRRKTVGFEAISGPELRERLTLYLGENLSK